MGWNPNYRYKILGRLCRANGGNLFVFDLKSSETYERTTSKEDGKKKTILIYNMRYKDSVEDKVHKKLSDRLQAIYDIFGQIPEVLEDVWVAMAQDDEQRALQAINKVPQKNPFVIKYEMEIPNCGDWEKCTTVLEKHEKLVELMKGW